MTLSVTPRREFVAAETLLRPTPTPVRPRFGDVLASGAMGLARGAEALVRTLPGGPMTAVALRGTGTVPGLSSVRTLGGASLPAVGGHPSVASPEGPGGGAQGAGSNTSGEGGVENSLVQAQEMNIYYLQIQEAVNAQNRQFTTLSNVLKAEHETVKTAIGNLR